MLSGNEPGVSDGMDALSIHTTATGCGLHAGKTTLIAFYVSSAAHLKLILAKTQYLVKLAEKNNNKLIYTVIGVANDSYAIEAVLDLIPEEDRILLAGTDELKHAKRPTDAWKRYLEQADLVEFVPDAFGSSVGTWLLPSSGDACLYSVDRGNMSIHEWKRAINTQSRDDLTLPDSTTLLTPFSKLGAESGVVATSDRRTFGMERAIRWIKTLQRDGSFKYCWPDTKAVWSTLSTSGMPAWSVSSTCGKMVAALTKPALTLDRQVSISDLQHDVALTLASLISKTQSKFDQLRGIVGPVVIYGNDNDEPMRIIEWNDTSKPTSVHILMLIPESYMRLIFSDYDGPGVQSTHWLSGFVCVHNSNILPIQVNGCHAEADDTIHALGTRLWTLSDLPLENSPELQHALTNASTVDTNLVYQTQQSAASHANPYGQKYHSANYTSFYTYTATDDPLSGLRVRCTFAASKSEMPTLDSDNFLDGDVQSLLESA